MRTEEDIQKDLEFFVAYNFWVYVKDLTMEEYKSVVRNCECEKYKPTVDSRYMGYCNLCDGMIECYNRAKCIS